MTTNSALRHVRTARPRLTVRGIFDVLAAADRRYRTRQQFLSLDEHLLRDMGLTRDSAAEMLRGRL